MTVTRFAPSPTGRLHLGHAFSAALGHARARESGGKLRLRIEDLDQTRCRPEFVDGIYEDLRWLGLQWDEPVLVQSHRTAAYEAALDQLKERGLVSQEDNQYQYRFRDIIDLETGKHLFRVEHEVRSATHPMYMRPLVNRNPAETNRTYAPGHEQWAWAMGPDEYDRR